MVDMDVDVEQYLGDVAEKMASQSGGFPEPASKDTLLLFVRDIVKEKDSEALSRSANLKDEEVGSPIVTSLVYFNVARFADVEGKPLVASFLRGKVADLAGLSLSRRAKLLETLFTVRRETKNFGTPKKVVESGLFGSKTTEEGVEK